MKKGDRVYYTNYEQRRKSQFNAQETSAISGLYSLNPGNNSKPVLFLNKVMLAPYSVNPMGNLVAEGGLFQASVLNVLNGEKVYTIPLSSENEIIDYIWKESTDSMGDFFTIEKSGREIYIYHNSIKRNEHIKILTVGTDFGYSLIKASDIQRSKYAIANNHGARDTKPGELFVTDLKQSTLLFKKTFENIRDLAFLNDTLIVLADDKLSFINAHTGEKLNESAVKDARGFRLSNDGKLAFILRWSGYVDVMDIHQSKTILSVIFGKDNANVAITPSGYYFIPKGGIKAIAFSRGNKIYPPEQLDIRFNRPDKVLEAISPYSSMTDTTLIGAYHNAYLKRLKKLEIDTTSFKEGFSAPAGDFINRDDIEYEQTSSKLHLKVWGLDSTLRLDRYNIWVNDVPLFGMQGINIRKDSVYKIEKDIVVTLSEGENKIETSVTNVNGIESYRSPLYLSYKPKDSASKKLYFVGIGINRFKDPSHPLQWCVKDIHDLADSLSRRYGRNMIIDTLFDENVNRESVRKIKEHLAKSSVDDKVIIAYSGHGLISKSYDYYLSAYNVNFSKPEEGGIPYDDLEWLLDSIPARNKLMLIDACHSGELDKDDLTFTDSVMKANGMKGLRLVSYAKNKTVGLKNSFELMQELFANVGRGTGATVLSAAGGTQLAGEDSKYGNGFFTYSILELMRQKKNIKVSELSSYVSKRVEEISNGLQKPTSRRENTDNDWKVW